MSEGRVEATPTVGGKLVIILLVRCRRIGRTVRAKPEPTRSILPKSSLVKIIFTDEILVQSGWTQILPARSNRRQGRVLVEAATSRTSSGLSPAITWEQMIIRKLYNP